MIELKLCFAAETVLRDGETNNVSAINLLEGLAAAGVPFFMQRISFFALWQRAAEDESQLRGRFIVALNETNLLEQEVPMDFGTELRTRSILHVVGLVVPGPGTLRFRIEFPNNLQAQYSVEVQVPTATVAAAR
jgi:hypothetical protein